MMNATIKTFTTKTTMGGRAFEISRAYAPNGSTLDVIRNFLSEEMGVTETDYELYECGLVGFTMKFVRDVNVFAAGDYYDMDVLKSDFNTILFLQDK